MQTPRRLLTAGGRREINITSPLQKLPPRWSARHIGRPPLYSSNFPYASAGHIPRPCRKERGSYAELYEGSKNTLQAVLESWQKSFGAAGQGAAALNRRFIDLAERNINTGFDLATGLAGARNLAEVMELQAAYWRKLFGELRPHQAGRALSSKGRVPTPNR